MYGSYCFIRQNVLVSPRCDVCGVLVAHSFFQGGCYRKAPARKACSMEDRGHVRLSLPGCFNGFQCESMKRMATKSLIFHNIRLIIWMLKSDRMMVVTMKARCSPPPGNSLKIVFMKNFFMRTLIGMRKAQRASIFVKCPYSMGKFFLVVALSR